jgi:hypothetical protein
MGIKYHHTDPGPAVDVGDLDMERNGHFQNCLVGKNVSNFPSV